MFPSLNTHIVATRETRNGKTYLIQRYQDKVITRGKTPDGTRVFTIKPANGAYGRHYHVPYDIARLAAGKDAWMRNLLGKCDCGANYPMHESDVPYCRKCQDAAEEENARLDRGE